MIDRISEIATAADVVPRATFLLDIARDRTELGRAVGTHLARAVDLTGLSRS